MVLSCQIGLPLLSSKPGAADILYLDFNGHETPSDNAWGAFSAAAFRYRVL